MKNIQSLTLKKIIKNRLKNLGVDEYRVVLDEATGNIQVRIPENEDTLHNPSYICHPFYDDDMVVVFPPEHPLASFGENIPPEELLNYPFLISQIQSATRRFIISRLNTYNIQLHNMQNLYNTETIKQSDIDKKLHEKFGEGLSIDEIYKEVQEISISKDNIIIK